MDDDTFWSLIDRLGWRHEGDDERVVRQVVHALAWREEPEIIGFQEMLARKLYAIDGPAWARESGDWEGDPAVLSVDGFLYSRCGVVASGRKFSEAVRADPSKMPDALEFEALLYIAPVAWELRTGKDWDHATAVSFETHANEEQWLGGTTTAGQ